MSSRPSKTDSSAHETTQAGRFVPLKTARYLLLTSFRQDGTPMAAPVRAVVDGDRAYFGARGSSGIAKRLRQNDWVQVVACTRLGMVSFGPRVNATARLLAGAPARQAAERLARKHPAWRDFLSSLARRVTGWQSVYYELRPDEPAPEPAAPPTVTASALWTRTDRSWRRLPPVPLR